ncbi:MAG: hypothetical protein H7326_06525 [Bdellovibrionaceae bacterium]|nr:hypothetical protein [Pseudobdellovibrionaceae bacterium]
MRVELDDPAHEHKAKRLAEALLSEHGLVTFKNEVNRFAARKRPGPATATTVPQGSAVREAMRVVCFKKLMLSVTGTHQTQSIATPGTPRAGPERRGRDEW